MCKTLEEYQDLLEKARTLELVSRVAEAGGKIAEASLMLDDIANLCPDGEKDAFFFEFHNQLETMYSRLREEFLPFFREQQATTMEGLTKLLRKMEVHD